MCLSYIAFGDKTRICQMFTFLDIFFSFAIHRLVYLVIEKFRYTKLEIIIIIYNIKLYYFTLIF